MTPKSVNNTFDTTVSYHNINGGRMEKYGYNSFLVTNKPQENEKTKPRKEKAKLK